MLDEPLAHRGVTGGGVRVVAHHEPFGARPLIVAAAGCHPDFFDPQVVGHVVVAAGAGQRGGRLGVGVAQLLGVDVVPAAAGEVGAVGGGGEAGIGDPHQPVQVPRPQVVADRADDPLVALTAGKGPAAHRDSVAGDRHRDHHLGQVVAVVLGLAEPARGPLDRFAGAVVGLGFGRQVGQVIGHVDLPVGGGGVDEDDVDSRLSRCATESKIRRGDLAQRVEQEVHRPIGRVVGKPGAAGDRDPFADPAGGGQLAARFQRPLCHQREQHPLGRVRVQAPVGGDPVQRRADAQPLPELVQQPRPAERRESRISISPVCAAVIACCGSRNREIEATSRASASRSTASARPKLWITFAEGTPVTGWRSLCASCRYDTVDPSRLRRFVSRRYTPTPLAHICW